MKQFSVKIFFQSQYSVYGLLLTAHIALVWWLPFFPTQDGPSHIYNLVILKDLLNGGQSWGEFYVTRLGAIPNLGFHIIAYPLLTVFTPAVTEKIFITAYLLLMAVGVPFFMRSFDKPAFPFSFLVFPVLFNFNLMMGFYSYCIAVPFFLMSFGLCYRWRNTSAGIRFIIYNMAGFVIYYMHLIAFGMFALSLATIVLSESRGIKNSLRNLLNLTILISPLIINLLIYLLSTSEFRSTPVYIPLLKRFFDLVSLSTVTLSYWQSYLGFLLFYVFLCLFAFSVYNKVKSSPQLNCRLFVSDIGAMCLLYFSFALILICLLSPFNMGTGSYFNQRFPWVITIVALPILHYPTRLMFARFTSATLVLISILFFISNAEAMIQKNSIIEEFLRGLEVDFPKGAFVMTYNTADDYYRVNVLLHAESYYGLKKGVFVFGNYEANEKYFPISFKSNLPALPEIDQIFYHTKSIDWAKYPAIQYLLVWKHSGESDEKFARFFTNIYQSGNLGVWRRTSGLGE